MPVPAPQGHWGEEISNLWNLLRAGGSRAVIGWWHSAFSTLASREQAGAQAGGHPTNLGGLSALFPERHL